MKTILLTLMLLSLPIYNVMAQTGLTDTVSVKLDFKVPVNEKNTLEAVYLVCRTDTLFFSGSQKNQLGHLMLEAKIPKERIQDFVYPHTVMFVVSTSAYYYFETFNLVPSDDSTCYRLSDGWTEWAKISSIGVSDHTGLIGTFKLFFIPIFTYQIGKSRGRMFYSYRKNEVSCIVPVLKLKKEKQQEERILQGSLLFIDT